MKGLHMVTFILLIIGGLNWGLAALGWNAVDNILGSGSTAAKLVYILVGLAAIVEVATHKTNCKCCDKGTASSM